MRDICFLFDLSSGLGETTSINSIISDTFRWCQPLLSGVCCDRFFGKKNPLTPASGKSELVTSTYLSSTIPYAVKSWQGEQVVKLNV